MAPIKKFFSAHKVQQIKNLAKAIVGIFYAICWLGAFLPIGPAPHMYLALFTTAEITSSLALIQGLCWSLVFGVIAGSLIAFIYNLLAPLDRR